MWLSVPSIAMAAAKPSWDEIVIDPFSRSTPSLADKPHSAASPVLPLDLRQFQQTQEKQLLEQSLREAKYNQKRAAELLGLTYHQLRALLKKHQMR
ncbi:Phage shock protein F [Leclercia adecarboxylata]|uniref:Phage shock protein F n=1 Tax=Leclercia adecarboxylata TaxID=83655 RepID=A0A4U9HXC5_9ENTR|nr:Phage shock protein F [Leclercia adecarboxylata]